MSKKRKRDETPASTPPEISPEARDQRAHQIAFGLLGLALLAALIVYYPVLKAGWFYDDVDYVRDDPRLERPELFLPGHWSDPPPPALDARGQQLYLQGYDKPAINDRYVWRLSYLVERLVAGTPRPSISNPDQTVAGPASPGFSHAINLALHLSCIVALFFAVRRLVALYAADVPPNGSSEWRTLFPGLAALAFAVMPWAAEPVVYVTARNGSMGALNVLIGLTLWTVGLESGRAAWLRGLAFAGALLFALIAYGCKENFISAPAGYLLATAPILWSRAWSWSKAGTVAALAGTGLALLAVAAWGIGSSDRARGLWQQAAGGRGWTYFFEIQNPLLLMTFFDQLLGRRIGLETNHPMWPDSACWAALFFNAVLLLAGTLGGFKRPLWLGIGWYYLHLIPTNSILPRPEFLSGRNVYLPVMGMAVFLAGAALWGWLRLRAVSAVGFRRWVPAAIGGALLIHWSITSGTWARSFDGVGETAWARSAQVAPDHATVRLNYAHAISKRSERLTDRDRAEIEREAWAALAAEKSPTMSYHTERPKALRSAKAHVALAGGLMYEGKFDEAAKHYRQSFTIMPLPETWIQWVQAALDSASSPLYAEAMREGARVWPDAWWVPARRGLAALNRGMPESSQIIQDLSRAEQAPDERGGELRRMQAQAILVLAQMNAMRGRAWELFDRAVKLGAAQDLVTRTKAILEKKVGARQQ